MQVGSKLPLPAAEEKVAFRAFDDVLRSDPDLKRVVKTWSSQRGEHEDLLMPCPALCPFVQLAVKPAGAEWAAEGQHKEPIYIAISVAVAGTSVDPLLDLWAAIRRAVFPQDPARDALVSTKLRTEAKVSKPTIVSPAIDLAADKKEASANMAVARGLIKLSLTVDT